MKLYDFQEKGVKDIINLFKTHRTVCLSWYTGAGKTNVLIELCKRMIKTNSNVKIAISSYLTTEIKAQMAERLTEFGLKDATHVIEHGLPKHVEGKNITVFNPQGMIKAIPEVKYDLFIVDEAHAGLAEDCIMLRKIMGQTLTKNSKILLVSATPWDALALPEYKDALVLKRPLDLGLGDGLINDFKFHAEEADIEFSEDDFSRVGDLRIKKDMRRMTLLKSVCIGKMKYLLSKYDKDIGKKCLVFCPPGNSAEIAYEMADKFGGLAYVMAHGGGHDAKGLEDTTQNLKIFKEDPKIRFLFVVYKCQVGFDYEKLSSCIDLTMSRNIRVLAQRCGRIARKDGKTQKHYFYVYDKSLMKDRLEWLICTMIDFCLGAYDGWTTKSAKYRRISVDKNFGKIYPISVTLKDVIKSLQGSVENKKKLGFVAYTKPNHNRTLEEAIKGAAKHTSRTDMWREEPALYKWFRLNAKAEMDRIFPFKVKNKVWNAQTIEALMKEWSGLMARVDFIDSYGSGAMYWIDKNREEGRGLLDKYFPSRTKRWTEERVFEALKTVRHWTAIRHMGGLRYFMLKNKSLSKGEAYYKSWWMTHVKHALPDPVSPEKHPMSKKQKREYFRMLSLESRKRSV